MRHLFPALLMAAWFATGCAAPLQKPVASVPALSSSGPVPASDRAGDRPRIGVAFGGGSARGLAHAGVIRWFEEHRIPIDLAAGTSMGGLVGGAFATGMDAGELDAMIAGINWDDMFGALTFEYKNIRRKDDGRAFPGRLEFGLKGGLVAPPGLNSGQQVEALLARITAGTYGALTFNDLPTPFRAVALDLVTASRVVLERGSLATAMRATMSIPLIFPPVELDGRVLVDGGTVDNVPADVVRDMGADRVIAINVGDLADRPGIAYTLTGVAGATLDAMMRASTREALRAADVIIDVPLKDYGSLDWRRSVALAEAGYRAAEAKRDELLPLAISPAEYDRWRQARRDRRRRDLPRPAFVRLSGIEPGDVLRLEPRLAHHVGAALDIRALERDLGEFIGLDRYESVDWRFLSLDDGQVGLLISARAKPYAPPFMMLGLNLENTTSTDFRITASARYLDYGLLTSTSELRIDATAGSNPGLGIEFYLPVAASPFFVAPSASVANRTELNLAKDVVLARYGVRTERIGLDAGVNLGRKSDLRMGVYRGPVNARVEVGDANLPGLEGTESGALLRWRYNSQDSPAIPGRGSAARARLQRVFRGPDAVAQGDVVPLDGRVTQFEATGNHFWSAGASNRWFVSGGIGTSFGGTALPTNIFTLGGPLQLGGYRQGELRGQHYYTATGGYLRQVGRLPDFMGGAMYAGGWLDQGDVFNQWSAATYRANPGFGVVMETLVGPAIIAGSTGFDGRWRTYVGIGRIFR